MYDFTKASDLVKWAEEQYKNKNRYKTGGIGRYDADGTRQFDCCGLFKCFMWHDYSSTNAKYYGKTQKDLSCEGLLAEAKEKGDIASIPEIPGVLVYMQGHMGIYIGNGQVIESTAAKFDGKNGKIYRTYFKGDGTGCDGKRATWTKWFKSPYLTYDEETKPVEPTPTPTPEPEPMPEPTPTPSQKFAIGDKVVISGPLYTNSNAANAAGSVNSKVTYITRYASGAKHPYNTTNDLGWMDEASITAYTGSITYTVKKGDTLSGIAAKYGTTWQQIYARNKFVIGNNPNLIIPGQVLVIKD